jgi:hypothetical protein
LLDTADMKFQWRWVVLGVIALGVLAQYLGVGAALGAKATVLANQPGVATVFQDPETGRTDALTALIAFAILTPLAAGAALLALLLVTKAFETLVVSIRLPGWLSAPVVGAGTIVAMYVTSTTWLPMSLYGLGIVARAYLVYAHGTVPIIR